MLAHMTTFVDYFNISVDLLFCSGNEVVEDNIKLARYYATLNGPPDYVR